MAPYGERPFPRGRRRAATRRTVAPGRRTTFEEPDQPHSGWEEEPLDFSNAPDDDPFVDAAPTVPPAVADEAPDPSDEPAMVVVATTPGVSAPQAPPLTAAPRAPKPPAPARRMTAPRGPAPAAAAPPAAPAPAVAPPAVAPPPGESPAGESPAMAPSGGPDPASEFGRMFGRLLVRMGNVERRLDGLDERLQATPAGGAGPAPGRDPAAEAQEAEREYDRQMLTWLADRVEALTADMADQRRQGDGLRQALDDAVSRAQTVSGEIAGLHAQLGERALALEARMAQLESLPSAMESVATDQFHRLAAELPSAPVDIEAVYKELDSVAEVLAARDAAVSQGLKQVGSLEATVSGLCDDFLRLVDELAASRAAEEEAQERLRALEQRLAVLESPEHQVDRLYSALDRARGAAPTAADTGGAPTTGIRVADGGLAPPWPEDTPSGDRGGEPQQAIQALAADLDRIRRSLEVLAEGARPAD